MDIEDIFLKYIKSSKAQMLKKSTRSTYTQIFERHFITKLKGKELNQQCIDDFSIELSKKLSPKTTCNVLGLLKSILEYSGIHLEIYRPKLYKKKIKMMDDSELTNFINYCLEHLEYKTYCILLTCFFGIRIGEICASTISDLDLNNGYINVSNTMQRIKNLDDDTSKTKVIIDYPKSPDSIREIPLIPQMIELGKKLYSKLPANAFLTTGNASKFIEPRLLEYHYRQVISKSGVSYKKYHSLRHKFATDFYNETHDVKLLAELLGHSDVTTCLNNYVHPDDNIVRNSIIKTGMKRLSRSSYFAT